VKRVCESSLNAKTSVVFSDFYCLANKLVFMGRSLG
jgi:hypothetical protein